MFTWQEAKESCEFIQSGLAFPRKQSDVEFYQSIGAGHSYWLGAKDEATEGYWLDIEGIPYTGFINTFQRIKLLRFTS